MKPADKPGIANPFFLLAIFALAHFPAAANCQQPSPSPIPQIVNAFIKGDLQGATKNADKKTPIALGQTLVVTMNGYLAWRQHLENPPRLSLYVDNVELRGAELPTMPGESLEFSLDREAGLTDADREFNEKAWSRLEGRPKFSTRNVGIAVGLEGSPPWGVVDATQNAYPTLGLAQIWVPGVWIFGFIVLVLIGLIIWLGIISDLLRDQGPNPTATTANPHPRRPFSLARVQMAWWLVLILAAYTFLWLITFSMDNLSGSALALLGISGGTGLVSVLIDGSKRQTVEDRKKRLEARKAEITTEVGSNQANATQAAELKRLNDEINQIESGIGLAASEGFILDILSDANGVTIYRLQTLIWTIVLGVIFVMEVYRTFTMPTFSPTLLGLMGLSSATYLGFKMPEPTAPST